jgi:hypothetical protein
MQWGQPQPLFARGAGDPWNAEKDETYVGPELLVQDKIRIGLGALVRVDDPDMRVIPRIEVGIGYLSGL